MRQSNFSPPSPLVQQMIRRRRRSQAIANVIASLLGTAVVIAAMIITDAPTWAWIGIGATVYLVTLHAGRS